MTFKLFSLFRLSNHQESKHKTNCNQVSLPDEYCERNLSKKLNIAKKEKNDGITPQKNVLSTNQKRQKCSKSKSVLNLLKRNTSFKISPKKSKKQKINNLTLNLKSKSMHAYESLIQVNDSENCSQTSGNETESVFEFQEIDLTTLNPSNFDEFAYRSNFDNTHEHNCSNNLSNKENISPDSNVSQQSISTESFLAYSKLSCSQDGQNHEFASTKKEVKNPFISPLLQTKNPFLDAEFMNRYSFTRGYTSPMATEKKMTATSLCSLSPTANMLLSNERERKSLYLPGEQRLYVTNGDSLKSSNFSRSKKPSSPLPALPYMLPLSTPSSIYFRRCENPEGTELEEESLFDGLSKAEWWECSRMTLMSYNDQFIT